MRITLLIMLAVLIGEHVSYAQTAYGQLGRNESEIGEALGSSSDATALFPAQRALRYPFIGSTHCEVGFIDDRAVYIVIEGGRLSVQQVGEVVHRFSPVATRHIDQWFIDRDQAKMYPPLNKQALRTLFVATGVEQHLKQNDWAAVRKYFDGYGQQIGEQELGRFSTITPEAHLTGFYRSYVARRGVARMTLIRGDRKVYATFDLTFDSESGWPFTSSVLIAEPETYWQLVLSQVRRAIDVPVHPRFPDSGEIDYENALASLVPPLALRELMVRRYLASYVAAVDGGEVSREVLRRAAEGVSELRLGRAISYDLLGKDKVLQQRRVNLIGEMRLDFAVERLITLLDDPQTDSHTKTVAETALRNIAIEFPRHPAPSPNAESHFWQRWWIQARVDRERN